MRSDLMKKGVERIPHRALFYALGFTDEELEIFRMRAQGMSIIQISFALGRTEYYSTEKVERRIRSIKDKIAAAIEG